MTAVDPTCLPGEELIPAGEQGYICGPADLADPTVKLEHPILEVPVIPEPVDPVVDIQLPTLATTSEVVAAPDELAYTGASDGGLLLAFVLIAAGVVAVLRDRVHA